MRNFINSLLPILSTPIKNFLIDIRIFLNNSYYLIQFFLKKKRNEKKYPQVKDKKYSINNQKTKIIFLYRSNRKDNASTIMRVFQLQKILKVEGNINIEIIDEKFLNHIKESICIINKSFLIDASANEFEILNKNRNILCLDYIDSKEKLFQIKYSHCLIASSIKQFNFYRKKYKNYLIHLITHHVDPRFQNFKRNNNFLKIGYFGERKNGLNIEYLHNFVKTHYISTNNQFNTAWIKEISSFNAHYIARSRINKNIFKPFLKGFTAAHFSSNVICCKYDGDSLEYLTKNYPYFLKDYSVKGIIQTIEYMQFTYKSNIWLEGLEIMKNVKQRSSNKYIIKEFKSLLNLISNQN